MMIKDVTIHFEDFNEETVYYISAISNRDGMVTWLSKDLRLTRVKSFRAFVRDYNRACELVGLIWENKIREGVGLFETQQLQENGKCRVI